MEPTKKKIGIIGDNLTGKSSLAMVLCGQAFDEDSFTVWAMKCVSTILAIENETLELEWWDLKSNFVSEDCRLRPLLYVDCAVVLICFSLDNPESLTRVEPKWYAELSYWCPNVPIILVGTKKDRRSPNVDRVQVAREEGQTVAERLKAVAYLECSAKTSEGVEELLMATGKASLLPRVKTVKKSKCELM